MRPETSSRGADTTRLKILRSAIGLFADESFETVGVRAIGSKAGVDPALINRYFGSKDELFVEVIRACKADWKRLWGSSEGFAERVANEVVRGPKGGVALQGVIVMLRSSGSHRARALIDQTLGSSVFAELEEWVGGPDADVRARLLMALLSGFAFSRDLSGDFDLEPPRADALRHHLASAINFFLTPPQTLHIVSEV